jgi:hypothetical protein
MWLNMFNPLNFEQSKLQVHEVVSQVIHIMILIIAVDALVEIMAVYRVTLSDF